MGGKHRKINREAQQVAVGDGNARKLVPGVLMAAEVDGGSAQHTWSEHPRVPEAHVVTEHTGPPASTWVTEPLMCITAGWTGLTEEGYTQAHPVELGGWRAVIRLCILVSRGVCVTGQRLAGVGGH